MKSSDAKASKFLVVTLEAFASELFIYIRRRQLTQGKSSLSWSSQRRFSNWFSSAKLEITVSLSILNGSHYPHGFFMP